MPCHGFEVASGENFHTLTVQFSPDLLVYSTRALTPLVVFTFTRQTASSRSQCSWQRHPLRTPADVVYVLLTSTTQGDAATANDVVQ